MTDRHPGTAGPDRGAPVPLRQQAAQVQFRILCVCASNVCRSVLAERLVRRDLAARLGDLAERFHAGSAGTEATPGRAMHPHVRDVLHAYDAGAAGFTSRRLAPPLVADSDLVLTATTGQRDRAIQLVPAALSRTFTLREFAWLAGHLPAPEPAAGARGGDDVVERARLAVARVQRMRGRVPYVDPASHDITDPRPTPASLHRCAASIAGVVKTALDVLCPAQVPAGAGRPPA
jgi:protein-tyrosine phosphatase